MDGLVTRFDEKRGFGFVAPLRGSADGTEPVYFHITQVLTVDHGGKPVVSSIGARLRFTIAPCARGHEAVGITIIHQAGEPQPESPRKERKDNTVCDSERLADLEAHIRLQMKLINKLGEAVANHQQMLAALAPQVVPDPPSGTAVN